MKLNMTTCTLEVDRVTMAWAIAGAYEEEDLFRFIRGVIQRAGSKGEKVAARLAAEYGTPR